MKEVYINIDPKLYKEVQKITSTDYEKKNDMIDIEGLYVMIEDLVGSYHVVKEKLQDIEENYTLIPNEKEYD